MIRPNRYYVHVYQAKVEFKKYDLRTLASRKMVAYLKDKWGKWYWPRRTDLLDKSQKNRRDKPKSLQPGNQWVDRSKQSERWSRHANRGQKNTIHGMKAGRISEIQKKHCGEIKNGNQKSQAKVEFAQISEIAHQQP